MFGRRLTRIVSTDRPAPKAPAQPECWERSYVGQYRHGLEACAAAHAAAARYFRDPAHVRLVIGEEVLATVRVHGSEGAPYAAYIWSGSPDILSCLKRVFGGLTVYEDPAPYGVI